MKFPISLWSGYYPELSPEALIDAYCEAGFHHMELSIALVNYLVARDGSMDSIGAAYAAYAKEHGMAFPQGHLSYEQTLLRPESLDILKRDIDLFLGAGIKHAVLHFNGGNDLPADQRREARLHAVSTLCDYIKGTDLILCLENLGSVPETHTAERLLDIIETVGSKQLGICLDTGHLHLVNGRGEATQSQREFITKAGPLLYALHITDNNRILDEHLMPFSSRYPIDWVEVVTALQEVNYKGLFNLELPGERFAPMAIRAEKLKYIRFLAEYLLSDEFLTWKKIK